MNNLTFSIIIPTYNVSKYIENTIQSVLNQTYKNFEIIIIDDKSTDDTLNKIKTIVQNNLNYNITLLKNKLNSKQGFSRNKGINISKGNYILFLDSDDQFYDKDVLKNLNNIIKVKNPDIIYAGLKAIGVREFEIIPNKENCNKNFRLSEYKWSNVTTICWKTSIIKDNNIKFPENIMYEDVYFNFLGICFSNTFEIADFILYKYITRKESSTGFKNFNQIRDTISLIEKLYKLKDIIPKQYLNCLENRINQQKNRIIPRLDRILKNNNM